MTTAETKQIPHSRPSITEEECSAMADIMRSGNIAMGSEIERFETELADMHSRAGGVAVNSGFSAIHLALLALGIGPGDEVILPSAQSCLAIAYAVKLTGAKVISCDCGPSDMNISADSISKVTNDNTRAIVAPHFLGIPSDLDKLKSLGLPIIEDCAQSIGATYKNLPTGSYGDLSVFSFYATKMITSIDGGMVLCDNPKWLKKMRDLRYYAGDRDFSQRYNYKMQNLHASLGLSQLKRLPEFIRRRREIARRYDENLWHSPEERLRYNTPVKKSCYFRYVVKMRDKETRNILVSKLNSRGVMAGSHMILLHRVLNQQVDCPNAESLAERHLSLPIYPALSDNDLTRIIDTVKSELEKLK